MNTYRRVWLFLMVAALLAGCQIFADAQIPAAIPGTGVTIVATAGPTCPVERVPPDPACAPRPVAGATIHILGSQNELVATAVTDAAGAAQINVPPGDYLVQPEPVDGLMGTAQVVDVNVVAGVMTPVNLPYDTGIR